MRKRMQDRSGLVLFLIVAFLAGEVLWAAPQDTSQDPAPGQSDSAAQTPAQPQMKTADPGSFPEVVARVNDETIGKLELLTRVETVRDQMHIPKGDLPIDIYRTVLNDMVDLELLYQSSRDNNLAATSEEVDKGIAELKAQYPDEQTFDQQLEAEAISVDSLRTMLAKDISIQKLVETVISKKVIVTDDAKHTFYTENESQMQSPEHLRLRHILVRVPEGATTEQRDAARLKIDQLRKQVTEEGADFATLARENSDDPGSREKGGELTVMEGQTAPPFEEAAFKLEPGAISDVVQTQFGFHIIQLLEKVPARKVPYEEVEERIEQYLQQEGLRQEVQDEVGTLRAKAAIAIFI